MSKGGHVHSGPPKDPNSRTSERAGFTLTALPSDGYDGETPVLTEYLVDPTARHEAVWRELWSTPQACAWSLERWRWPVVADLVKWMVRSDDPSSPASVATSIRQLRDDLGISTAGLIGNGWAIAPPKIETPADPPEDEVAKKRERRLREPERQADAQ